MVDQHSVSGAARPLIGEQRFQGRAPPLVRPAGQIGAALADQAESDVMSRPLARRHVDFRDAFFWLTP
ncbi:hypothetical protein AB0D65_21995 [Streptomyces griseoloalbus]|uniref:Uncharacterized protein n=1 Tax=Streptomyces griseoloalbus TaxID=67303 RepID=A0ABV3E9I7_9ACTN